MFGETEDVWGKSIRQKLYFCHFWIQQKILPQKSGLESWIGFFEFSRELRVWGEFIRQIILFL